MPFYRLQTPFDTITPAEMLRRMPQTARSDLTEWNGAGDPELYVKQVLGKEISLGTILSQDLSLRITDDKPFNEYYLLRWLTDKLNKT